MAKNLKSSGDILTLTAPSGGVVSGTVYKIGGLIVVALNSVAQGERFTAAPRQVLDYAKVSAQAWTEGLPLYWDDSAKNFTSTVGSNTLCAKAGAVADNPSSTGSVILNN